MPVGGISPARSLRTTFSATSACSPRFERSSWSSSRFAVLGRALWQVTQYWSSTLRGTDGSGVVVRATAGVVTAGEATWRPGDGDGCAALPGLPAVAWAEVGFDWPER